MRDTAMAFAWLYKNAAQYGADPNTIFVMGGSAGAHMAALFGADSRYLQEQGLASKNIKGVILSSGLYDMGSVFTLGGASGNFASTTAAEHNSSLGMPAMNIREFFGNDYNALREAGAAAYIGKEGKDTPPYLIAYTDDDIFSLAQQAIGFYDLFLQHHLPAVLVEQPGRTHPTKTSGIDEKLKGADDVLGPAMKSFMQSVLAGTFGETDSAVWVAKGAPAPDMKVSKDLRYDDSAGSDPKLNSLDLYLPAGKQNVPLVFYVHGGGWRAGDKANPTTLVNMFGRMGVGLASINYRLAPEVKHPGQIQDVAKAFAWVYKNASQYGIDRNAYRHHRSFGWRTARFVAGAESRVSVERRGAIGCHQRRRFSKWHVRSGGLAGAGDDADAQGTGIRTRSRGSARCFAFDLRDGESSAVPDHVYRLGSIYDSREHPRNVQPDAKQRRECSTSDGARAESHGHRGNWHECESDRRRAWPCAGAFCRRSIASALPHGQRGTGAVTINSVKNPAQKCQRS